MRKDLKGNRSEEECYQQEPNFNFFILFFIDAVFHSISAPVC